MTNLRQAPERALPTLRNTRRLARALLAIGIVLIAANLRPAIAATATMLDSITSDLHLSGAAAGILTTLPVLFFGLCGPAAPLLVKHLGIERTLALALAANLDE